LLLSTFSTNKEGKGEGTLCFFLLVIASSFLPCHCEALVESRSNLTRRVIPSPPYSVADEESQWDYFVVWFFTRTDGIASPAFGGLAMTEGVRRARNDRRSKAGSMTEGVRRARNDF